MKDDIKIELHEYVSWTEDHIDAIITVDYYSNEITCIIRDEIGSFEIPLSKTTKDYIISNYRALLNYEIKTHSTIIEDVNILSMTIRINSKVRKITIDATDYDLNPEVVNILYDIREGRDSVRTMATLLNKYN